MNNLIQAITDYTTTLEQKLSALEARVAQLEASNEAMRREGDEARALIAALQAEVATLATAGAVVAQTAEPEVEIELIVEEEPQEEVKEELEKQETIEPIESLEILDEVEVVEPVAEPAPAPQPEAKAEPVAEPTQPLHNATQPLHNATQQLHNATQPLQTSLFGTAVEDIRQAISLGDRFLFQRELFAGNGELMQKTLDEINGLGSLSEAMDYVRNNFDWDKESTAVQLFENVLKRRFS